MFGNYRRVDHFAAVMFEIEMASMMMAMMAASEAAWRAQQPVPDPPPPALVPPVWTFGPVTSITKLYPVHYLILDWLRVIAPAKYAQLNRRLHTATIPAIYQEIHLNGMFFDPLLEVSKWDEVSRQRMRQQLRHAEIIHFHEQEALALLACIGDMGFAQVCHRNLFPNVKRVVFNWGALVCAPPPGTDKAKVARWRHVRKGVHNALKAHLREATKANHGASADEVVVCLKGAVVDEPHLANRMIRRLKAPLLTIIIPVFRAGELLASRTLVPRTWPVKKGVQRLVFTRTGALPIKAPWITVEELKELTEAIYAHIVYAATHPHVPSQAGCRQDSMSKVEYHTEEAHLIMQRVEVLRSTRLQDRVGDAVRKHMWKYCKFVELKGSLWKDWGERRLRAQSEVVAERGQERMMEE
ncbi:hypothetical protein IAT38_002190 [Cryptococcus sp. DSM 104549]